MNKNPRIKNIFQKNIKYILILILPAIIIPIFTWCKMRVEIRHTLAEAKNIELALRLTAIEYYGSGQHIYDSLQPDGLTEGTAQVIEELSGATGDLTLGSWDSARGAANRFIYVTDRLVVVYNYDEWKEEHWQIYYKFKDVKMPHEGRMTRE